MILTDVANRNISKEAALVLLVDVHDFNEDKANLLTTEVIRDEQSAGVEEPD